MWRRRLHVDVCVCTVWRLLLGSSRRLSEILLLISNSHSSVINKHQLLNCGANMVSCLCPDCERHLVVSHWTGTSVGDTVYMLYITHRNSWGESWWVFTSSVAHCEYHAAFSDSDSDSNMTDWSMEEHFCQIKTKKDQNSVLIEKKINVKSWLGDKKSKIRRNKV